MRTVLAAVLLVVSFAPQSAPATEPGPFREPDLVELTALDPTIKLDVRYATANNLAARPVYSKPRAFLQRPAAEALVRAHRALQDRGYGGRASGATSCARPWNAKDSWWISRIPFTGRQSS